MLTLHRSLRADRLADVLADTLARPLADPLATEVVCVPAYGVERWLQQRLASRLGIAANIDYRSPGRLLAGVVEQLADVDDARLWQDDALVWPVLAVLDAELSAPELAVIARYLGVGADAGEARLRRGRRLGAARTIAGLFARYGWQRPTMLAEWAAGTDGDGTGAQLAEQVRWQPWLWRRVREQLGRPHPAESFAEGVARLVDDPAVVDLPDRFAVFGISRLPAALRDVLGALGRHRDIGLYVPHPSDRLWAAVAALAPPEHERAGSVLPGMPRLNAPRVRPAHPLLGALGRDVQELQLTLRGIIDDEQHYPADSLPQSLLGALQQGLAGDRLEPGVAASTTGLEIHSCHGPGRQVEVLRDRLLRLFADDDSIEPRDVLIVCPDLPRFAPLIRGVFAVSGDHPAAALRVRLADRGLRDSNAVLDVLATLLDRAVDRMRVGELLDLAATEPVRRCFGFTDDDLEYLADWAARSGIRWGIDDTARRRFGLGGFRQGTAQAGLDRIVLGVAADEADHGWLDTALPLGGIDSTATDLAGRFTEFVELLGERLALLAGRGTRAQWEQRLIDTVDLLTDTEPEDAWQRAQALRVITQSLGVHAPASNDASEAEATDVETAGEAPVGRSAATSDAAGAAAAGEMVLDAAEIRDLLAAQLADRPTRSNFCTGELTVASLVPMRAVPHRVIIGLGFDAGAFPAGGGRDGDDLLGITPLVGERDAGADDRQAFLDLITAATEQFIVFYSGNDPVTGAQLPPAVVVSELSDAADILRGTPAGTGSAIHRHTLHGFDEANFVGDRPLSFDPTLLPGAIALSTVSRSGERGSRRPVIADAQLPAPPGDDLDLDELIRVLTAPIDGLVRQRLGIALPDAEETHPDRLAIDLDGLEKWAIGDRYLTALLDGQDPQSALGAELRRGTLPPFRLGAAVLGPIRDRGQAIATATADLREGAAGAADIRVDLADGRRLTGTVGGLYGTRQVAVMYSRLGVKHRFAAWIRLLALRAGSTSPVTEAVVVGGGRGGAPTAERSRLRAPDEVRERLELLVAVYDAALRAPLGLTLEAGEAAAREYLRRGDARAALRRAEFRYEKSFSDGKDAYAALAMNGDPAHFPDFARMHAAVPAPDSLGTLDSLLPGDRLTDTYIRLATAVFGPMLEHEEGR